MRNKGSQPDRSHDWNPNFARLSDIAASQGKFTFYFMLRIFSLVVSILSLPFILNNIGLDSFAMVSILLTLFQLITILDWGLGNFIIARFTPIFQNAKMSRDSEFVTKFLPLLPVSSILLVAIVFLVDRFSVLKLAFSLGNGSQYQTRVYLFYLLSLLSLIFLCLTKMLLVTHQRDNYQMTLSMNVVFPQLILLGASFFSFSFIDLVIMYQLSSILVYFLGLVGNFTRTFSNCSIASFFGSGFKFDFLYLLFLIQSSYRFFILQLIGFFTSQAGVLIVAQFSDSDEVAEYSIIMRILGVHIAFVSFIFGASQSEINQILKSENIENLRRFFFSVYVFSTIFITLIFSALLVFRENVLLLNLLGGTFLSTDLLLAGFFFLVVWSLNFPFSVVAISDFPHTWYFRAAVIAFPINLVIALALVKYLNFLGGPLVANCISMFAFSILPFVFFFFRNVRQLDDFKDF